MTTTETVTIDGVTYTIIRGEQTPDEDMEPEHADGDGMTAQDWQQFRAAAAERAQRADDAALYNEQDGDSWGVGY